MEKQGILLSRENAQALLNYLETKPHKEVSGFINMIIACPLVNVAEAPEAAPTDGEPTDGEPNRSARRQMEKIK